MHQLQEMLQGLIDNKQDDGYQFLIYLCTEMGSALVGFIALR